jgi:Bacterial protein of unknown function (DUF922)
MNKKFRAMQWVSGLILILTLPAFGPPPDEDYVFWSADKKLEIADFKARPDITSPMKAMTNSGIVYSWQCDRGEFTFEVVARFDRLKSWIRSAPGSRLLQHEQGHFDITEIYARKMRKMMATYPNACQNGRKIDAAAEALYGEWDQKQGQYDSETNHALNESEQLRWEKWIAAELEALAEYAHN